MWCTELDTCDLLHTCKTAVLLPTCSDGVPLCILLAGVPSSSNTARHMRSKLLIALHPDMSCMRAGMCGLLCRSATVVLARVQCWW